MRSLSRSPRVHEFAPRWPPGRTPTEASYVNRRTAENAQCAGGKRDKARRRFSLPSLFPVFFLRPGFHRVRPGQHGHQPAQQCRPQWLPGGHSDRQRRTRISTTPSPRAWPPPGSGSYTTTIKVNNYESRQCRRRLRAMTRSRVSIAVPVGNIAWIPGTGLLTGNLTGKCTLYKE